MKIEQYRTKKHYLVDSLAGARLETEARELELRLEKFWINTDCVNRINVGVYLNRIKSPERVF